MAKNVIRHENFVYKTNKYNNLNFINKSSIKHDFSFSVSVCGIGPHLHCRQNSKI
jgi:hypothetical protein